MEWIHLKPLIFEVFRLFQDIQRKNARSQKINYFFSFLGKSAAFIYNDLEPINAKAL